MKKGNAGIIVLIIALFVVVLALAAYMVYDFTKDNLKDLTDKGSEIIGDAVGQLSSLSATLQNQIVQSFDGKTMSGTEVLAACIQYQNSNNLSVKVIVSKDKEFNIGRHNVKIEETVKQTLTEAKEGAVNVTIIGENTSPNSLTEIQSQDGVNASQIYYSYVMKNPTTGDVIGIIFVKKDWNKENTDNKDNNVQNNEQSSSNDNDNVNNSGTTSNNNSSSNINTGSNNSSNNFVSNNENIFLKNLNAVNKNNFVRIRVGEYREFADSNDFKFVESIKSIMAKGKYVKVDTEVIPTNRIINIYTNLNTGMIITVDQDTTIYAVISGNNYEVWEVTGIDSKQVTNIIDSVKLESALDNLEDAKEQLSNISQLLQNQVISSYSERTMTGAEVIAACMQYQNTDISVRIVVSDTKQFQTGKYAVKLNKTDIDYYYSPKKGDVFVSGTSNNSSEYVLLDATTKDSLTDIQASGGVSAAQTYYSYIMYDKDTDKMVGILFVKTGISSNIEKDAL